ncbi:hypothetical protein N9242_02525 [Vicingaceae bacterium]|nr:hypothetical protein [Vicingaceae bacterium]
MINQSFAQSIPSKNENIPYLVTFSNKAELKWGDDDFNQIIFFSIPENQKTPFYIRIFDPNVGGKHDEKRQGFNSKTKFSLYGAGCFSKIDEENKDPIGDYKKGNLISSKTFGNEPIFDDKWYSIGPINPLEGELIPDMGGYIFKLNVEGISGDDGNLYRLFMSVKSNENRAVEGGNAFMYEYSFRLNASKQISHIYPYIDQYTIAVVQENFDFDNDAYIKMVAMSIPGVKVKTSNDGVWTQSLHKMKEIDKKTCLDIQIVKTGTKSNNNVVFSIKNNRGKYMQFHSIPIGAIPKKKIGIKPVRR